MRPAPARCFPPYATSNAPVLLIVLFPVPDTPIQTLQWMIQDQLPKSSENATFRVAQGFCYATPWSPLKAINTYRKLNRYNIFKHIPSSILLYILWHGSCFFNHKFKIERRRRGKHILRLNSKCEGESKISNNQSIQKPGKKRDRRWQ